MSGNIAAAVAELKQLLGRTGFIDRPAEMEAYLTSWRNGWTGTSPLIALPSSTQQVADIVKILHTHRVAIVPQGGNTGLVGGGIPSSQGNEIVISLSRLNKIRALDTVGATVTVEAGVVLQTLQEAAADAGFLFPLSMGSQGSAQIGGAISTNAGGTAVLRYGNMRNLVLGIEAVLPDGQVVSALRKLPKDNTGYNAASYFIGAEGTFGVVTAATLKLFPKLKQSVTAIAAIPDVTAAMELLAAFRGECAEYLTAFEIISHSAMQLVVKHQLDARMPLPDTPYYLLIELGAASEASPLRGIFENLTAAMMERGKILDAVMAETGAQAKQFWALRENISESMRREGHGAHFDISLPLDQIAEFLGENEAKIKKIAPSAILAPFGHIGDGNIHYNMYFKNADAENLPVLKKRIQDIVYTEVKQRGGSISAEHGIGIERKAELLVYKSPAEIDLMKRMKRAFDPDGLMNPGKIFDL